MTRLRFLAVWPALAAVALAAALGVSAVSAQGPIVVNDDDGLFEIRADLIGEDRAGAVIEVSDQDGAVIYEFHLLLPCPHAEVCRMISDVFVLFESGGTWLVDLKHEGGKLREARLEIELNETTLDDLNMPPFPAPPAVAARGDGSLMPDGIHMIPLRISEGAATNADGELRFSDDDGMFTVRAYFVAPNLSEATLRIYSADDQLLYDYPMIVACPIQPLCRVATDLPLQLGGGGTWIVGLEHDDGVIYDWQLEIYRDEPTQLPTTGGGGLLDGRLDGRLGGQLDGRMGAQEVGVVALAALGVSGLSLLTLLARRRSRAL